MNRKMGRRGLLLSVVVASGVVIGCSKPVTRNIIQDVNVAERLFKAPRPCQIQILGVTDSRPEMETLKPKQGKMKYVVPAIIWNQWASAGPIYAKSQYYGPDIISNLAILMNNVLKQSGLGEGQGKVYLLQAELNHYYGVAYSKKKSIVVYGGAYRVMYDFYPTGYVGIKLTLTDQATSQVVATRYLSESYLFNPNEKGLSTSHTAFGPGTDTIMDNKTQVAVLALQRVMMTLPYVVDQMLANEAGTEIPNQPAQNTFFLWRLTKEYDFQEEVVVETETGRILRNQIVKRNTPVISKPDEWVVAPIDSSGHWMSDAAYRELIKKLNKKYNLTFSENLMAVNFGGMRE